VIIALFERIGPRVGRRLTNYFQINSFFSSELAYTSEDMFTWDDLWFWGFITRRTLKGQQVRSFEWNEAKYLSIPHAPKKANEIGRIHALASEFLALVG